MIDFILFQYKTENKPKNLLDENYMENYIGNDLTEFLNQRFDEQLAYHWQNDTFWSITLNTFYNEMTPEETTAKDYFMRLVYREYKEIDVVANEKLVGTIFILRDTPIIKIIEYAYNQLETERFGYKILKSAIEIDNPQVWSGLDRGAVYIMYED